MRTRVVRRLGIMSLAFLAHLGTQSCSSSSEGDGDVEASENGNAAEGDGANPDEQANANAAPENDNLAQNKGDAGGDQVATGETPTDTPANSTNADLKEIMQDVNAGANGAAPAEGGAATADAVAPSAPPVAVGSGPAGGALPEFGSKMPYIVQPGDTLAKISGKLYGNAGKWKLLASLSNLARPNKIYPGDIVYYQLTQESQKFAQAYETVPRQEVKAEAGDTLAKISQRVLGSKVHWRAIWRQNDTIDNPDEIAAGSSVYYIKPNQLAAIFGELSSRTIAASQSITNKVLGADIVVNTKTAAKSHSTKTSKNWAGVNASAKTERANQSNDIALDLVVSGISAILI